MKTFLRNNGLSIVLLGLFLLFWAAQGVAGYLHEVQEERERGRTPESCWQYLASGDFWEATGENWESEFLQMAAYVLLAAWLVQRGSAESRDPDEKEEVQEDPAKHPTADAPWPVRRGGWVLRVYNHSLSLAFMMLFLMSFVIHTIGGWRQHNQQQLLDNLPPESLPAFVTSAEFWFQSFQNWQSEFLSIFCMVVLTIFLREKNSSQSKPVHAPHTRTGE